MRHNTHCLVCDDPLVQARDGDGKVWWVHLHVRNDDHDPVPVYDHDERLRWTSVDSFFVMMVVGLVLLYLFVNR